MDCLSFWIAFYYGLSFLSQDIYSLLSVIFMLLSFHTSILGGIRCKLSRYVQYELYVIYVYMTLHEFNAYVEV